MAEGTEQARVSLLVPHPRRTAVLVAEGSAALPFVVLPTSEPRVPEILDVVGTAGIVDTDTAAVLRQVITAGGEPGSDQDDIDLLVELDAGPAEPLPGWTWLDLDADAAGRLVPETARAAVASWAHERETGWAPLRPAWSRPGWLARARAWMEEQMAAAGSPATAVPLLHQLWGISAVLRAPSDVGDVYLKCSPDVFRHEAVLTRALAERMPELVTGVIAVESAEGWMLMLDLGAPELGDQDESSWHLGLETHASLQRSWLRRTDELTGLGLPVRSLDALATEVEELSGDAALMERASAELRDRWLAAAPALAASCRRLDEIGPGPTLVHGDLHPWNVVSGPAGTRVFDWTDAAVSHPFVDLATYVFRTRDVARRRELVDSYVRAWSGEAPDEKLREAAALGLVVGAVYQVQTYRTLLPTLMREGADDGMAGGDLSWMNDSITRLEQGLESRR